jgi:hypothetical protein
MSSASAKSQTLETQKRRHSFARFSVALPQRGNGPKPNVAARRLRWVCLKYSPNLNEVAANRWSRNERNAGRNPVGIENLGLRDPKVGAGAPTLGFAPERRWRSFAGLATILPQRGNGPKPNVAAWRLRWACVFLDSSNLNEVAARSTRGLAMVLMIGKTFAPVASASHHRHELLALT